MAGIALTVMFMADFGRLPQAVRSKAEARLREFQERPNDPRFEAHRMQRALMPNLWTAKLDGAYRFIYRQLEDGSRCLLCCGHHDEVYKRAERLKFVRDGAVIDLTDSDLAEVDATSGRERPAPQPVRGSVTVRITPGRKFMAWTDTELLDAGVPEHLLTRVRGCDSDDELLDLAVHAGHLGDFLLSLPETLGLRLTPSSPDHAAQQVEQALRSNAASGTLALLEPDELERVLTQPIEDWMIFLHPEQATTARRRTVGGPARVRGAAGTGKTVVALHRAAFLARRLERTGDSGPILFTTLIRSLPPVLEGLFERLAPDVAKKVEFVNVHRWASQFLRSRGRTLQIDSEQLGVAFERALDTAAGRRLLQGGLTGAYLREEIQYLIKGRGIGSVQDYLALPRTARGTPLRAEQRRDVWQVARDYHHACAAAGVHDFDDLILDALHELGRHGLDTPYAAIVVDEAQDLTEVSLRMLVAALRPGGELLLVGDGQQSIYPGGFSLRSIGLEVRGRSAVLTTSYRSTAEIMGGALAVMAGHDFDDLDDQPASGERTVSHTRHGLGPIVQSFPSRAAELSWLVDDIRRRERAGEAGLGDVAVLCPDNRGVEQVERALRRQDLPVQPLTAYAGRTTHAVKVGTYNRGKGLEFKVVYLPGVTAAALPRTWGGDPDEARELDRRRFFVAMTRARDVVVITYDDAPSEFLTPLLRGQVAPTAGQDTGQDKGDAS